MKKSNWQLKGLVTADWALQGGQTLVLEKKKKEQLARIGLRV